MSLVCMALLLLWISPFLLPDIYRTQLIRGSLFASVTLFFIILLIRMLFQELENIIYTVTDDTFIKKTTSMTITIPLAEIVSFEVERSVFGSRHAVIRIDNHSIRLSSFIEHLSECITLLEKQLVSIGNGDVLAAGQLSEVKYRSIISDFHAKQALDNSNYITALLLGNVLLTVVTAFSFWSMPIFVGLVWVILGSILPLIGLLAGHMLISIKLLKALRTNAQKDFSKIASSLYSFIFVLTGILYCIAGIVYKEYWVYFWLR